MIGKTVAAAASALLALSAAQAESWRASSTAMGATAYIDTDSIRREGDQVRYWREIRWPGVRTLETGTRYDRLMNLNQANCATKKVRSLEVRLKLGDKVVVSDFTPGEVEAVKPGTTLETDLRAVCSGEWPKPN